MALTDFKTDFINRYQDRLFKSNVGKKIANMRFQDNMRYGDTVTRFILDTSAVRVRAFTNLTDRTIDPITDSEQSMTINVQVGAVFPISNLEKIQAGPLNPALEAGADMGKKVANYLDAIILAETRNAFADFDNGDLTTMSSTGAGITLNSTTVPQLVTRANAKLTANNAPMTAVCWVLDPYAVADIAQYPIGKDITNENTVFKNGFSGNIYGSEVYSSNNLTSELVLTGTGTFSNGETITIGTITLTAVSSIGSTAGNFLIGADLAASLTNLTGLLNAPGTTSSTQVALSAANQIKLVDTYGIGSTHPNGVAVAATSTTVTIVGIGSGRLAATENAANASFTKNVIHSYYGQKGAIDVAVQVQPDLEMREEPKQRTTNVFCDVVAAVKTFTDGSQYFLDVLINA